MCGALLIGLLLGGDPGLRDVFEPGFGPDRMAVFESAVQRQGVAALVRQMRRMEPALKEIEKRLDREYKAFLEVDRRWYLARDRYGRDWKRKHGRLPAEYEVSVALTKEFFAQESRLKQVRHLKHSERLFHERVVARAAELATALRGKARQRAAAALLAGCKDGNPWQRARCASLLPLVDEEAARARALELRGHPEWRLRAAAIRTLGKNNDAPFEPRGRLIDDLEAATGRKSEAPEASFFSIPSRSCKLVFCLDGTGPVWGRIKREAAACIRALPADALFGIVCFRDEPVLFRRKLSSRKTAALEFLETFRPGGEANVHDALMASLDLDPDTCFLVTVAEPKKGRFIVPQRISAEVRGRNVALGVRIHAVGVSGGARGYWLEKLTAPFCGQLIQPR